MKNKLVNQTPEDLYNEIVDRVYEYIDSEIWLWDRETHRRNRTTVRSPRDIVDTGKLRNDLTDFSLKYEKDSDNRITGTIIITLSDYATYVHEGTAKMDGRPYVAMALEDMGLDYKMS